VKFIKWTKKQIIMYLLGCTVFSFGAKFFIDAELGTDPLDVLVLGIVRHTGLTIGIVSGALAIMFLLLWSAWNWKIPPITPFVTMFLVGNLIDLWNLLRIQRFTTMVLSTYPMLFFALFLASYGSSLIIMSGIGIRTMDLVAITIMHKWNWNFFYAKMLLEVGFVISGWLLGGPIGIGTIAFVCIVGPCIIPFMSINKRSLNLPNYGLAKEEQAAI
jgi:uncharacterized protein